MKKFFVALIAVMLLGAVAGLTACGETQCEHNYEEDTARTVAATCHSDGTKYMVCSKCGDETTEKITNRPNHAFTGAWVKVDNDVHARKCANCEAVNTATEAHNFVADTTKTDVAATCHSDGTRYLKCSDCGAEKTEAITNRPVHTYGEGEEVVWVKVDETNHAKQCKTTGCGYVDNAQSESHNFVADSSKTDIPATCHSDGTRYLVCTDCGAEKTETITDRPDHDFTGEWVKVDNDVHARKCANCEAVDATTAAHNFVADTTKTDVAATCHSDGTRYLVCSDCGAEKEEVDTNRPAHNYGEGENVVWVKVDETDHAKQCINEGCDYTDIDNKVAHTWDEGEVTAQPVLGVDGVKTFTCTDCNATYDETLSAKTSTTYKEGFSTEIAEGKLVGDWCYGSVNYTFGEKEDFTFEQFTNVADGAWKYDNTDPEQHVEIKDGYINASGKWAAVGFTFKTDMTATVNFKFTGTIPGDGTTPQSKFNCRIGVKNAEGVIYGNPEFRGGEVCSYEQTIEFKAGDTIYFMMEHAGTGWSSGTLEISITHNTNTQGA